MGINPGRYPELDACRGVAIVLMIFFHFFVDLTFLGLPGPDPFSGLLHILGLSTATLFIGIAGISAHIKIEKTPGFRNQMWAFTQRGGKLLLIGFGITSVTWWYLNGEGYVVFGILHLIGCALVMTPLLRRLGYFGLLPAFVILTISYGALLPPGPLWMAWSGVHPEDFVSVDYTPLIPWLSVFLAGLSVGKFLYPSGIPRYSLRPQNGMLLSLFGVAGRHSLAIYLIHQPVLILLLSALSGNILD